MAERIWDTLIVGGGPAGYAAALYCARAGLSALVLEGTAVGGQLSTTEDVDNYPGIAETVVGIRLAEEMQRGAARFGAETRFARVTALALAGERKRAETAGGALLGRVKGCIILFLCAWVLRYLGNIIPEEAVTQTRLLKFFMTTNPVTLLLGA